MARLLTPVHRGLLQARAKEELEAHIRDVLRHQHDAEEALVEVLLSLTDRIAEAEAVLRLEEAADGADERCRPSTRHSSSTRTLSKLLRKYT